MRDLITTQSVSFPILCEKARVNNCKSNCLGYEYAVSPLRLFSFFFVKELNKKHLMSLMPALNICIDKSTLLWGRGDFF